MDPFGRLFRPRGSRWHEGPRELPAVYDVDADGGMPSGASGGVSAVADAVSEPAPRRLSGPEALTTAAAAFQAAFGPLDVIPAVTVARLLGEFAAALESTEDSPGLVAEVEAFLAGGAA